MSLPLSGVRVVEMGQLIAIPHCMKLLGDMGAQVIRIETCSRLDNYRLQSIYGNNADGDYWDRAANFYEQNRNKMSLTLDLTDETCLSALKDLISVSDVFVENFTPRVMRNFGLEYEDLRKIRPDIIMVSSTGYGYVGPWSDFGAIGFTTEAASGLASITGYRDGPPTLPEIPYADYTAAEHTAFAVMAALVHRANTGEGQFIDVSQSETLTSTIPEAMMDFTVNGRTQGRIGNEHPSISPHGCYPCAGEDSWIAISAATDEQWLSLCSAMHKDEWAEDVRFEDAATRVKNRTDVDSVLSAATGSWDAHQLMRCLQDVGVAAGAVLNGKQLLFDPHLKARGFYETVEHDDNTGMPPLPYSSRPWKFSRTPGGPHTAAPTLGRHNRLVLAEHLGLSNDAISRLEESGVVGQRPSNVTPPRFLPLDEQLDRGLIISYEDDYRQQLRSQYD